jgi:glycogen operon protein
MATRISGSSDLYQNSGRHPYHSINFVTSHDGYSLNDLVSYEQKHNQDNGEDNCDGENHNYSSNYGVEGPTRRKHIFELRQRQMKNMMASLLLSQGTPMISAGDEVLHTKRGNNNSYCQDNAISWFDWKLVERNAEMLRFCQTLIAFRKEQPNVRRVTFLTGAPGEEGTLPDVSWYGPNGNPMDWNQASKSILCVFGTAGLDDPTVRPVMLLLHAGDTTQDFTIPPAVRSLPWKQFIDTSAEAPADIYPALDGPPLPPSGQLRMIHHTLMCYVG